MSNEPEAGKAAGPASAGVAASVRVISSAVRGEGGPGPRPRPTIRYDNPEDVRALIMDLFVIANRAESFAIGDDTARRVRRIAHELDRAQCKAEGVMYNGALLEEG